MSTNDLLIQEAKENISDLGVNMLAAKHANLDELRAIEKAMLDFCAQHEIVVPWLDEYIAASAAGVSMSELTSA